MIELTVKTLDSANHIFRVDAESTVRQLKEKIREGLGLEIDRQRLIFCGRVLLDDQKLNEAGIENGKCLHLVERAPPSPPHRRRDPSLDNGGPIGGRITNQSIQQQIRNILRAEPTDLVMDQQVMSMTPTAGRMEFIRRIIIEIRNSMTALRTLSGDLGGSGGTANVEAATMETETGGPAVEPLATHSQGDSDQTGIAEAAPMETDASAAASEPEQRADEQGIDDEDENPGASRIRRARAARAVRSRYSRPRDLGQLLEELDLLHEDFAPFRTMYAAMLRDLTTQMYPEEERQQRQDLVRLICDTMHSFAHGYHSISDITFHVGQSYPRLTSEPPSTARHMPMQAHINVVTTTGRRPMPGEPRAPAPGAARAGPGAATATATEPATSTAAPPAAASSIAIVASAGPAPASATLDGLDGFTVRRSSSADRSPIHTTTRTIARPAANGSAPLHYQVEIETRGHIAIPFDNSLLNLASVASNLRQAQGQHEQAIADVQMLRASPQMAELRRTVANPDETLDAALERARQLVSGMHDHTLGPAPEAEDAGVAPLLDRLRAIPIEIEGVDMGDQPLASLFATAPLPTRAAARRPQPPAGQQVGAGAGVRAPHPHAHTHAHSDAHVLAARMFDHQQLPFADVIRPRVVMRGMELLMNMDDIPGFIPGTPLDGDVDEHGVYIAPIAATPSADMLHSIVANVLRQNVGDALQMRSREAAQARASTQGTGQGQGQSQNQGQGQSQSQERPTRGADTQQHGQDQRQENPGAGPGRGAQHRRPTERAHSFAMACMVYDRYLNCDSTHARRHLNERRENYQRQAEQQERARAARAPPPDIDVLMERNARFTPRHITIMMRLLSGPVSEEGQLNAFLVTIARHLFLEPMNDNPNDPTSIPMEFATVRRQLREYVQRMLARAFERGGDTFEAFTERIFSQNADFLRSIPSITRVSVRVDLLASLRAMTRSRLPALIACVMSEASGDMFAARFYSVFARFYSDLCALVHCFCEDGFDGLARLNDAFLAGLTQSYECGAREWLRLVARENLVAIRAGLENHVNLTVRQYFRRADGTFPPPSGGTPTTASEEPHLDSPVGDLDDDTQGSDCSQTDHDERCSLHQDTSSSSSSAPTDSRSPEEERSLMIVHASAPAGRSEGASPRRMRRWGNQSPSDSRSLASDLTSEPHPPGLIAIDITDSDASLFDIEDLDINEMGDIDPLVGEYTVERRPIVYSPLNVIEDDTENSRDDDEIDIETIDDDLGLMSEELAIRKRREKREGSIRRDVARTRQEGNLRHKRFITMQEAELQLDRRAAHLSARDMEFDQRLRLGLQRVADEQTRLEEEAKNLSNQKEIQNSSDQADKRMAESGERSSSVLLADDVNNGAQMFNEACGFGNLSPSHLCQHNLPEEYDLKYLTEPEFLTPISIPQSRTSTVNEQENDEPWFTMPEYESPYAAMYDDLGYSTPQYVTDHDPSAGYLTPQPRGPRDSNSSEASDSDLDANSFYVCTCACANNEDRLLESRMRKLTRMAIRGFAETVQEIEEEQQRAQNVRSLCEAQDLINARYQDGTLAEFILNSSDESLLADDTALVFETTLTDDRALADAMARADAEALADYTIFTDDTGSADDKAVADETASTEQKALTGAMGLTDDTASTDDDKELAGGTGLTDNSAFANDTARNETALTNDTAIANVMALADDTARTDDKAADNTASTEHEALSGATALTDVTALANNTALTDDTALADVTALANNTALTDDTALADDTDLTAQAPSVANVMEQFERGWEPVLRGDGAAQAARATRPQEPYSDAYLSGMPSRKRRYVRDARPDPTLDALMNEGLRAVGGAAGAGVLAEPVELRQYLRGSVRAMVRSRARAEPDNYSPAQFQNTAAFLDSSVRPKSKEPEEKPGAPHDQGDLPPDAVE